MHSRRVGSWGYWRSARWRIGQWPGLHGAWGTSAGGPHSWHPPRPHDGTRGPAGRRRGLGMVDCGAPTGHDPGIGRPVVDDNGQGSAGRWWAMFLMCVTVGLLAVGWMAATRNAEGSMSISQKGAPNQGLTHNFSMRGAAFSALGGFTDTCCQSDPPPAVGCSVTVGRRMNCLVATGFHRLIHSFDITGAPTS